jgi:glucosylceramidase
MTKIAIFIAVLWLFSIKIKAQFVTIWISRPNADENIWLKKDGFNFFIDDSINKHLNQTIEIKDEEKYQKIDGFGASLSESSCWLLKFMLTSSKRKEILDMLFGSIGIHLSMIRLSIGSSQFSWDNWTYDDAELDDWNLTSFSVWRENAYIRPILEQALKISNGRLKIFSAPYTPPAWMKTKKGSSLRADCYNTYANYLIKYIQTYEKSGIRVHSISIQNEPWEVSSVGMLMKIEEQLKFITLHLGPRLTLANLKTKILSYDYKVDEDAIQLAKTILSDKSASKYIAGVSLHFNDYSKHEIMASLNEIHSSKGIWITKTETSSNTKCECIKFLNEVMHLIRASRNWAKSI